MGNSDISQKAISLKGKSTREAQATPGPLLVSNLGWRVEEVQETRGRLAALEEDWDAPGMEAYDHL
jgi:hypothetical protein